MKKHCDMADDLIQTLGSYIGVPCRFWLRRHHSIVSSFNEVPVYVVRCKEDLHLGLERFVKGADWLGRISPIWLGRMPMLLGSIMLLDNVETSAFFSPDRCCAVNPWRMTEVFQDPKSVYIAVGGFLLFGLFVAHMARRRTGSRLPWNIRTRLGLELVLRYLDKSVREYDHFEVRLQIDTFETIRSQVIGEGGREDRQRVL